MVTQWAQATGNKHFLGEFGVAHDAESLAALDDILCDMSQHTDAWHGGTAWGAGPWRGDYMYSVEPQGGVDKPQMDVMEKFPQPPAAPAQAALPAPAAVTSPATAPDPLAIVFQDAHMTA